MSSVFRHSSLAARYAPLALWFCLLHSGCSESKLPQTVPVSGRATLDGGEWPRNGNLYFSAAQPAAGFPRKPAMATFGTDGEFTVTSWSSGDGLVPGKYRVSITCWEIPPTPDGPPAKSYIPERYTSGLSSNLELIVKPDAGHIQFDVDIPPRAK